MRRIDGRMGEIRQAIRHDRKQAMLMRAISTNIRLYRAKSGLSQQELATLTGFTQPAIARLEADDYNRYTISTLWKLSVALGVNVSALVHSNERSKR